MSLAPRTALLLIALGACTAQEPDDAATLLDLSIEVVDPVDGTAVEDAWIVMDLGDELLTARTGGDGTAFLPDLPADTPIDLTAAAPDRVAFTWTSVTLADVDQPWTVPSSLVDEGLYDTHAMSVSGTVQGAPIGSWVMFYGARDYHDYVYVTDEEPVAFSFTAELYEDEDTYMFSAVALDQNYELQGVAVTSAQEGDSEDLDLVLDAADLQPLELSVTAPNLAGTPASAPPSDWCIQAAMTAPAEATNVVTGWNALCGEDAEGFVFTAQHLPLEDQDEVATVYLADDWDDTTAYSWASVPLNDDTASVTMLDTPVLDATTTLEPDAWLGWEIPTEARDAMTYVIEGDQVPWLIYPGDDTGLAYPRLPDDFDPDLLPASGTWVLYARDYELDEDDQLSSEIPYRVAAVYGGQVAR